MWDSTRVRARGDRLGCDPNDILLASLQGGTAGHALYRSTDGGWSWTSVEEIKGPVSWLGFESKTDGPIVSANGRTIWTTHDAGAQWTAFTFR